MALFSDLDKPCCSSTSGTVLLVVHAAASEEYDFCYDIPEGDFPAIAAGLEEVTANLDRQEGIWKPGRFALRIVRLCNGCGKNEEVVSFDIPLSKTPDVQADVLAYLDAKGLVRRGEVWSVE